MSVLLQKSATASAAKCGRVAVLMGGDSAAREVSLNSGKAVHQAGLEMSDLVLKILEATLTGDGCDV
jgi:murein endopeptidase